MQHIIVVVVIWFFSVGSPPQFGTTQIEAAPADCQAFVAAEVAKREQDPTVRYVEGHCFVQGVKS